jgi:hypothetical protein
MWIYYIGTIFKVYLQLNTSVCLIRMGVDMFIKSVALLLT